MFEDDPITRSVYMSIFEREHRIVYSPDTQDDDDDIAAHAPDLHAWAEQDATDDDDDIAADAPDLHAWAEQDADDADGEEEPQPLVVAVQPPVTRRHRRARLQRNVLEAIARAVDMANPDLLHPSSSSRAPPPPPAAPTPPAPPHPPGLWDDGVPLPPSPVVAPPPDEALVVPHGPPVPHVPPPPVVARPPENIVADGRRTQNVAMLTVDLAVRLRECGEGGKIDPNGEKVFDLFAQRKGVWLSCETLQGHADRIGVYNLTLAKKV